MVPPRAVNPITRLSGLAFCAACQRRMKSCWQENGPRNARVTERALRCPHQPGKSTQPCYQRPIITLSFVEDRVRRWLIEQAEEAEAGDLALVRKVAATAALASADKIQAQIRRQERRRAKAVELFMDEEITSKDEVKAQIAEVDAEIARLCEAERSLPGRAANEPPSDAFLALGTVGTCYIDDGESVWAGIDLSRSRVASGTPMRESGSCRWEGSGSPNG
jgi:hypothetical protein